jgi:hypothetical protein
MLVAMILNACCKTQIVHPMMAETRQVQENGAVVFSKIVVNQNSCQDLSEKLKITAPEQDKCYNWHLKSEDGSHIAGSFGAIKP